MKCCRHFVKTKTQQQHPTNLEITRTICLFQKRIDVFKLRFRSKMFPENIKACHTPNYIFKSSLEGNIPTQYITGDKKNFQNKLELLANFSYGRVESFILCKFASKVCHLLFVCCHNRRIRFCFIRRVRLPLLAYRMMFFILEC